MKKKVLSYFLSFLMVMSIFTQSSTTSLYAEDNVETPASSEVQQNDQTEVDNQEENSNDNEIALQNDEEQEIEPTTVEQTPSTYQMQHITNVSMTVNGTDLVAGETTEVSYGDKVKIKA